MIEMKIKLLLFLLITPLLLNARAPEWVSSRPDNSFYYWGVGVCELAVSNHAEIAKKAALDEIVSQIATKVESNSFMTMEETDLSAKEDYKKQVKSSSYAYLEGMQIYDTFQDKRNYYVCYRLSKDEYNAKIRAKSEEISKSAYECLMLARAAEAEGNLITAVNLYHKGLEIVEPWLFLNLIHMSENVPTALLAGYTSVFDGLTLTLQPQSSSVTSYQAINVEIVATLAKNGTPIKNFPLSAQFVNGSGKINHSAKTDELGQGYFYLTQLSGKETTQSIKICVDNGIVQELPVIYHAKMALRRFPEAVFTLNVEQQKVSFIIMPINDALPPLVRQISSVLANDNLIVTTNVDDATHYILMSTSLAHVGSVNGDLRNLDEWLASLIIQIKDRKGTVLTQYSDEGVRVLVSENAALSMVEQQASKELMKKFKRDFPKLLHNINIK